MPENSKKTRIGTYAIAALVGGVAGAITGLMVSPKSGAALRKDIKTKAVDLAEQVQETTVQHTEAIVQKGTDIVDKGKRIKDDVKTLIHDFKSKKTEIVQAEEEPLGHSEAETKPSESVITEELETLP